MKLTIDRKVLEKELTLCMSCVTRKTTIPILEHVLLDAWDGWLRLVATDTDKTLETGIEAVVEEPGCVTFPISKPQAFVSQLSCERVSFATDARFSTMIVGGKSKIRIPGTDGAGFPQSPPPGKSLIWDSFAVDELADMIGKTVFAVDTQGDNRFTLSASLLESSDTHRRMVASDGHRLSVVTYGTPNGSAPKNLLLPIGAIKTAQKILTLSQGNAELGRDNNNLYLRSGHRLLTHRLIAGSFPDYSRMLPKEGRDMVCVNRKELLGVLQRVSICSLQSLAKGSSHKTVTLLLDCDALNVSGLDIDGAEASEQIEVEYSGKEIKVGVEPGYLEDFLSAASSESVDLFIVNGTSMMELRPTGIDGYRYLLMPKRLEK